MGRNLNRREDQPPGDSAGEAEKEQEFDSIPVPGRVVSAFLGERHRALFPSTFQPVGWGKDILLPHLKALCFRQLLFLQEGFDRSNLGVQFLVGFCGRFRLA